MIDVFAAQNPTILELIVMSLSAILAIVFSISLMAIQHAAEKYTPTVLGYYVKSKSVLLIFLTFFAGIIFSLFAIGHPINRSSEIGFAIFITCLFLVYYNFRRVSDFVNPLNLLGKITDDVIKRRDEENQKQKILDISLICRKSEENIAEECIRKLEFIGEKIQSEGNKHNVLTHLKTIGKKYAKEPTKQHLSVSAISSLLALVRENIKIIKEKLGTLYLVSDSIIWAREIFDEVVLNKDLNEIENRHIMIIFSSTSLAIKDALKDEPDELEAKRRSIEELFDLMRHVCHESRKIPRLKTDYKWVVRDYKMRLDGMSREMRGKKIPDGVMAKYRILKKEAENLYNKYW